MSAGSDNFGLAAANYQRRLASVLGGSGGKLVTGDASGDAFWEGLQQAQERANANGLNFKLGAGGSYNAMLPPSNVILYGSPESIAQQDAIRRAQDDDVQRFRLNQSAVEARDLQNAAARDASQQQWFLNAGIDRAFQPGLTREQSLAAAGPAASLVSQQFAQQDAAQLAAEGAQSRIRLQDAQAAEAEAKAKNPGGGGFMSAAMSNTDPKAIADSVVKGEFPPDISQYSKYAKDQIASELAKRGYNLSTATTDWKATQKHIATMNSSQQLRLTQAINALPDMLDSVDNLASKWKGGNFPALNRANLALAKNGAFGPEAQSIATQLDAQIADVNGDLGVVYMGGNSPTDHALELASKALSGDWSEGVIHDMVGMAKKNVQIRHNSIANTGVAGASADNPYAAQAQPAATAPPASVQAPQTAGADGSFAVTAPNGQTYHFKSAEQAAGFRQRAGIQ